VPGAALIVTVAVTSGIWDPPPGPIHHLEVRFRTPRNRKQQRILIHAPKLVRQQNFRRELARKVADTIEKGTIRPCYRRLRIQINVMVDLAVNVLDADMPIFPGQERAVPPGRGGADSINALEEKGQPRLLVQ